MSDPRYAPRDFCAEPESFGKSTSVLWLSREDERFSALVGAAKLQHLYAVRIRARAKAIAKGRVAVNSAGPLAVRPGEDTQTALKTLATKSGISYTRWLRCLRGEVVLRLDDIAWADLVLGQISEQAQPVRDPSKPAGQHPLRR